MKPDYAWTCRVCEAPNAPGSTSCVQCSFPPRASAREIEAAKRKLGQIPEIKPQPGFAQMGRKLMVGAHLWGAPLLLLIASFILAIQLTGIPKELAKLPEDAPACESYMVGKPHSRWGCAKLAPVSIRSDATKIALVLAISGIALLRLLFRPDFPWEMLLAPILPAAFALLLYRVVTVLLHRADIAFLLPVTPIVVLLGYVLWAGRSRTSKVR